MEPDTDSGAERDIRICRRAWKRWNAKRHIDSSEIDTMFRVLNNAMLLLEAIANGGTTVPNLQQRPDADAAEPERDDSAAEQLDRGGPQPAAEV
jgi:hypothetical protein